MKVSERNIVSPLKYTPRSLAGHGSLAAGDSFIASKLRDSLSVAELSQLLVPSFFVKLKPQ